MVEGEEGEVVVEGLEEMDELVVVEEEAELRLVTQW
jgi:hypothetical protein